MKIGERIKFMRTQMALTQQELADKFFYDRILVRNWERGTQTPSPEQLKTIENLYSEFQKQAQREWFNADDKDFPKKLRAFRHERKLTQIELAEAVGTKRREIISWESGKEVPKPMNIKALRKLQQLETKGDSLDKFHENFPEKLKALQKHLVCTIEELAEFLGVGKVAVFRWLDGTHLPTITMARDIEQICANQNIDFNNIGEEPKISPNDISKLRNVLGLTQEELATQFSIHIRTVQAWEQRGIEPVPKNKRKLLDLRDNLRWELFGKLEFLLNDKEFSIADLAEELNDITDGKLREYSIQNWMAQVTYPTKQELAAIDKLCANFNYKKPTKEKES